MNYPNWADGTKLDQLTPAQALGVSQFLAISIGIKLLIILRNGVFHWARQTDPEPPVITPNEDNILSDIFGQGNPWGLVYPTDNLTLKQAKNWLANYWDGPEDEALQERRRLRGVFPDSWLSLVDLKQMFYGV